MCFVFVYLTVCVFCVCLSDCVCVCVYVCLCVYVCVLYARLSPEIFLKRPVVEGNRWRLDCTLKRKAVSTPNLQEVLSITDSLLPLTASSGSASSGSIYFGKLIKELKSLKDKIVVSKVCTSIYSQLRNCWQSW